MTTHTEPGYQSKFVSATLPWLVAAAALVVYGLTLNHWVSFGNVPNAATMAGETWRPEVYGPLYYLVTYPLRWLSPKYLPLALNIFAMVCAGFTLALLARSVALLPHDRTYEQRIRERHPLAFLSIRQAWIPPVLAALACGLQLTFWERATAGSGDLSFGLLFSSDEMFQLLLFAYIIRSLLEYRLDERESWLTRSALIYGAAMANNWGMVGFLPAYIATLIWIRGFSFFDLRFLTRMALFGLAGTLFYLLLPGVQAFSADGGTGFWQAFWQTLKATLVLQKTAIQSNLVLMFLRGGMNVLLMLAVTSLLPILLIAIRWPSQFGDSSRMGAVLALWLFHFVHALLLVLCVWVMFDPTFSPRHLSRNFQISASFLTLYYLAALSVGYLSGYFLVVFRPAVVRTHRPVSKLNPLLHRVATVGVWALLILAPVGLIYKNAREVRMANGPAMEKFAEVLTHGLPGRAVVLCDDERKLLFTELALQRSGRAGSYVLVDTRSLRWPHYHRFLQRKYSGTWPPLPSHLAEREIASRVLQGLMIEVSKNSPIYYLHPSFGYYFENFYQRPHGGVYELALYPPDALQEPPMTDQLIEENETFWRGMQAEALEPLIPFVAEAAPGERGWRGRLRAKLHLPFQPNLTAAFLASSYSRQLNYWGVQMQRAGKWDQAAQHFARAVELNPRNLVADVNLEFNSRHRAGQKPSVPDLQAFQDQENPFERVLNSYGPFDEPNFCYEVGRAYARARYFRQAVEVLERTRKLASEHIRSRLLLGRLYLAARRAEMALEVAREMRAHSDSLEKSGVREGDVLQIELASYLSTTNTAAAEALLHNVLRHHAVDEYVMNSIVQVCFMFGDYSNALAVLNRHLEIKPNNLSALANKATLTMQMGDFTNALTLVDRVLESRPDDPTALFQKGVAVLRLGEYDAAIPVLTKVLTIQTNNYYALLNRAIAHLHADKLEASKQDYRKLLDLFPKQYQIHYGLAEIAMRQKDRDAAIQYYEMYLANAPDSAEAVQVRERLESLRSGAPWQ